jgi:hypothetical protein
VYTETLPNPSFAGLLTTNGLVTCFLSADPGSAYPGGLLETFVMSQARCARRMPKKGREGGTATGYLKRSRLRPAGRDQLVVESHTYGTQDDHRERNLPSILQLL